MLTKGDSSKTVRGVIASAQEGRFMLASEDGRMRLMILAPSAGVEPQDLPALVARACPVTVRCRPAKGRRAEIADRVAEA